MITTVPWQLESSIGHDDGAGRRGPADDQVDVTPYG